MNLCWLGEVEDCSAAQTAPTPAASKAADDDEEDDESSWTAAANKSLDLSRSLGDACAHELSLELSSDEARDDACDDGRRLSKHFDKQAQVSDVNCALSLSTAVNI